MNNFLLQFPHSRYTIVRCTYIILQAHCFTVNTPRRYRDFPIQKFPFPSTLQPRPTAIATTSIITPRYEPLTGLDTATPEEIPGHLHVLQLPDEAISKEIRRRFQGPELLPGTKLLA